MSGFDREKHLRPLLIAALALLLLCGFWLYNSHQQALHKLERKASAAREELAQLQQSIREYRELESKLQQLSPQSAAATNLITTVESATQQVGARSQLLYVRPQPDKVRADLIEEGVEIKLEKLFLSQLVELLYQLESVQQQLQVSQLRIRTRFDNPEQLDTVMVLSRFREKR